MQCYKTKFWCKKCFEFEEENLPCCKLQLCLFTNIGTSNNKPDSIGSIEADAHVRLKLKCKKASE